MTIQIKDLTGCQQIDMSAVRGGPIIHGDAGGSTSSDVPYYAWVNDVIMSAVPQGPVAIVAAASQIPL